MQTLNLNVERWSLVTAEHVDSEPHFDNFDLVALCDDISVTNDDGKPWNYNELTSSGKRGVS